MRGVTSDLSLSKSIAYHSVVPFIVYHSGCLHSIGCRYIDGHHNIQTDDLLMWSLMQLLSSYVVVGAGDTYALVGSSRSSTLCRQYMRTK